MENLLRVLTFPILIALHRLSHTPNSLNRAVLVMTCFLAMLGFSLANRALASEFDGDAFTLIGRVAGPVRAVAVSGDYAYVGVGYKLLVFNVVDPVHPQLIFEGGALAAEVQGIALSGDHAYVAAGEAGLQIYNIDDPSTPVPSGSVKTDGAAGDVVVLGSHAYIPAQAAGLRIVDVSDPAAPVEVGHYENRNYHMRRVAVRDNLAYVTTHPSGLRILDVTDSAAPVQVGRLALRGRAQGIALGLHHAYIATGAAGLRIVNISDPRHPTEVAASIKHNLENAYDVVVSEDYAYVAGRAASYGEERIVPGGLRIVNIRTPRRPVAMGKVKGSAWSVNMTNPYLYVAAFDEESGDTSSFDILNVTSPAAPKRVASFSIPPRINSRIVAKDGALYTIDDRLRQFDLTDPHQPQLGWSLALATDSYFAGQLTGLAVSGSLAFVGGGAAGLHIVDLSDPAAPHLIMTVPVEAYEVAANGNLVFVSKLYGGIRIVDVTNRNKPAVFPTIKGKWSVSDMQAAGDYLYVANYAYPDSSALLIYNIHDPTRPVLAKSFDVGEDGARLVEVADQYAYLGIGTVDPLLMVVDISTPSKPKKMSELAVSPSHISDMTLSGTTLYLTLPAIPGGGLRAIDVSDPAKPRLNGEYQMSQAFANAVAVLPDDVIALGSSEGLLVLEPAAPQ